MKRWQLSIAVMIACSAAGCVSKHQLRTANSDLERENFQLEQRLDQTMWELDDVKAQLEACRCGAAGAAGAAAGPTFAPAAPRRRSTPSRSSTSEPPAGAPSGGPEIDAPPKVELPDEETRFPSTRNRRSKVPAFRGPPLISPPESGAPDGQSREIVATPLPDAGIPAVDAAKAPPPGDEAPPYKPHFVSQTPPPPAAETAPPPKSQTLSPPVVSLMVNPAQTKWRRVKGNSASDEGLEVVVEPRDAAGKLTEPVGIVAIVVLDPALSGDEARLARWDFGPDEVRKRFHAEPSGGGLRFALKWPKSAPSTDDLLLFVRLTAEDGQQMVAEYALQPAGTVGPAAAWSEVGGRSGEPALMAAQPTRWQKATAPIPPLDVPAEQIESRPRPEPSTSNHEAPTLAETPEAEPEPAGPSWAPYR